MPKTNIPSYRLHKPSGQAIVELGGRRFYLGKYGSKASKEKYEQHIADYLANGRKLPPTKTKTGISCLELSVRFLEWAESYYVKNGKPTPTFSHCRNTISLFVKYYGNESVDNFSPTSLVFYRKNGLNRDWLALLSIVTFQSLSRLLSMEASLAGLILKQLKKRFLICPLL